MEHRRHARNNGACDPGLYRTMYCIVMHHACTTQRATQCATHLRKQRADGADERCGGHHAKGPVEDRGGGGRTTLDLRLEGWHSAEKWDAAER